MANPNGAQDDGTGNVALSNPDVQAVAMAVASTSEVENLNAPDWDIEAAEQPILVASSTSSSTISGYSNALGDIVNQDFIASNLTSVINNENADPSQAAFVQSKIQQALGDSLGLKAPSQLINFQKSWVKMLVYQKNYLALLQNVNDDPIKTSLVMQAEESKYNAALQELQMEMQKAQTIQGFSFGASPAKSDSAALAFFNNILGIKTARAQWLTFDASNFGEWLLKFAKDIALQILKNTLMALIQRKVLAWIQGSGAPRFITSWASTMVNAYTQSALSAIDTYMNNNCAIFPGFAPQLRLQLGIFYKPDNPVCSNLLQASLGRYNFQQFYQNFQNGGWLAYGASMLPSGNYYGGLAFAAQGVDLAAYNAKNVASVKATANQGCPVTKCALMVATPMGCRRSALMGEARKRRCSGSCRPVRAGNR